MLSKLGLTLALLALLRMVPATVAVDLSGSGLARPRGPWLLRQVSSTACPFRRFPWLCQRPSPRHPR
jgi:hypothetical protein